LPSLGDSITEGTVVSWEVQEGQAVKPDDVLALVETDKVTVEIKATMEGVITNRFAAVYVEKKNATIACCWLKQLHNEQIVERIVHTHYSSALLLSYPTYPFVRLFFFPL
jgi:protein-L-isoaspartate O-methyltransferase